MTHEAWACRVNHLKAAHDIWKQFSHDPQIHFLEKDLIDTIFGAIAEKILQVYDTQNFSDAAFSFETEYILNKRIKLKEDFFQLYFEKKLHNDTKNVFLMK